MELIRKYTLAETLTHHAWQLALGLQVTLVVMPTEYWLRQYSSSLVAAGMVGIAHRNRQVWLAKLPHSSLSYAIVLHELGHIAHGHSQTSIDNELMAWDWAHRHSMVPWNPVMARVERYALWSHAAFGACDPKLSYAFMPLYGGRIGLNKPASFFLDILRRPGGGGSA